MQRTKFFHFFILTLGFHIFTNVGAQERNYRPNVLPPSPDAASLGMYADIPVTYYSGMPNISIPFYTVTDGNLQLPISLSYQALGNKIESAASFAGLGWSLNAGGLITRSVKNIPDDYPSNGFLDYSSQYSYNFLISNSQRWGQLENIANGCADAEPDAYFFNFNGYTGKFTFDWTGALVIDAEIDWKVEILKETSAPYKKIIGWKFTGDDGTVYTFSQVEQTTITQFDPSYLCTMGPYISSWHLTNIKSVNGGREINLAYTPYTFDYGWSPSVSHRIYLPNALDGCTTQSPIISGSQMQYSGYRVLSISNSGNGTTVSFDYLTARTDETNGTNLKQLDAIKVSNRFGSEVRKFVFAYDYSTGRLTLKSITEQNNGQVKPPYVFTYNIMVLPPRWANSGGNTLSNAQDHWGFYNGKTNNLLLPPAWRTDDKGVWRFFPGGDRSPDKDAMMAGILTKIKYPTGGIEEFVYEPHDYSFVGATSLVADPIYELVPKSEAVAAIGNEPINDPNPQYVVVQSQPFDVEIDGQGSPVLVTIAASGKTTNDMGEPGGIPYPYVELVRVSDGSKPYIKTFSSPKQVDEVKTISIAAGQYILKAYAMYAMDINANNVDHAAIKVSWKGRKSTQPLLKNMAGGPRIKEIKRFAYPGDPDYTTRQFLYQLSSDPAKSSGVLNYQPSYIVPQSRTWVPVGSGSTPPPDEVPCFYDLRLSVNKTNLGNGNHMGYSEVTELIGIGGINGKTVYKYTAQSNAAYDDIIYDGRPYQPPTSYAYKTGHLLSRETFKKENGSYFPVSTVSNTYSFYETPIKGLKVDFEGGMSGGSEYTKKFLPGPYDNIIGRTRLAETVQKEYPTAGGVQVRQEKKQFVYDAAHRYVKSEKFYLNENSDYDETLFFYPKEFSPSTFLASTLTSKNIVGEPLEVVKKRVRGGTGQFTGGVFTKYAMDGSRIFPSEIYRLQLADPASSYTFAYSSGNLDTRYASEIVFNKYDAKENISQFTEKNGIQTSFLWDKYNGNPMAAASHAAWDKIAYSGFEDTDPVTFGPVWTIGSGFVSSDFVTGKRSYNGSISINTSGFTGEYVLSFWMKGTANFTVNGTAVTPTAQWSVHETKFTVGSTVTINTNGGLIDEVRIFPSTAHMTSYAHDQLVGVNSMADAKGRPSLFTYDNLGRLRMIKDHNKDIVKRINYEYDVLFTAPVNFSIQASQTGDYVFSFTVSGSGATSYEWNFGDGSALQTTTSATVSHTFPSVTLKYNVRVTAKNGSNPIAYPKTEVLSKKTSGSSTECNEIQAFTISKNPNNASALEFTFTAPAPNISGATYVWNTGESVAPPKYGTSVSHTYGTGGFYTVTLSVTVGGKVCLQRRRVNAGPVQSDYSVE